MARADSYDPIGAPNKVQAQKFAESCGNCGALQANYLDTAICKRCNEWQERHNTGKGWFFWDELHARRHGPFHTEEEMLKAEARYWKTL